MQSSLNHAVIKGSKIPVCISLRTPEQIVHYKLFGHTIKIETYRSDQLYFCDGDIMLQPLFNTHCHSLFNDQLFQLCLHIF